MNKEEFRIQVDLSMEKSIEYGSKYIEECKDELMIEILFQTMMMSMINGLQSIGIPKEMIKEQVDNLLEGSPMFYSKEDNEKLH